jgi:hypothetical protein
MLPFRLSGDCGRIPVQKGPFCKRPKKERRGMKYASVDKLQKTLAKRVFHYAKDAKKASGRALGTLVEIITFYSLKSWGLEHSVAIERPLPEFANTEITHKVEYSLHPVISGTGLTFSRTGLPLTARKIAGHASLAKFAIPGASIKSHALLTHQLILRNSCTICDLEPHFLNAYLTGLTPRVVSLKLVWLHQKPYAIFECKRVGVEEGMRRGPQTIEKAKQGAYVARTVSSLQKVRFADGRMGGLLLKKDGTLICEEYYSIMEKVIGSNDAELLADFILTIGVVSNHGNWFTSDNHNKEMKVLAQSYDWLLFLTDNGIAQFIDELLLNPKPELKAAKKAFLSSYTGERGVNQFTKVQIALEADAALQAYFGTNMKVAKAWFNVIAPAGKGLNRLKQELDMLKRKPWERIHK